jgi:hypothetical protein
MRDRWHSYELVGCAPPPQGGFTKAPAVEVPILRSYQHIETLCEKGLVDIVILSDGHRADKELFSLARKCERAMVDFMVIPSEFQILLSDLGLTTVSGIPLLGITRLPIDHPLNAAAKRTIDILGALQDCCSERQS